MSYCAIVGLRFYKQQKQKQTINNSNNDRHVKTANRRQHTTVVLPILRLVR